ncbi:ZINC KNUCKLE CX2CX4HX4C-RELATED [Salix viminalis]|uniref:ZINC KNUCKLE CX2CX4HX4C-RELATED n=1 Tax=Salix viminalis TaxID=40686 RepID=A0A9Q0NMH9_SALVM|nr:ZINC KNUCKLE CX2CX4HX4C-RELATED [Salix viminalis]
MSYVMHNLLVYMHIIYATKKLVTTECKHDEGPQAAIVAKDLGHATSATRQTTWADKVCVSDSSTRHKLDPLPQKPAGSRLTIPAGMVMHSMDYWKWCIIGFFTGCKLPYHAINTIAKKVWSPYGLEQVTTMADGFFIFRFRTEEAFSDVIERGPWMFGGKNIILQKWSPRFQFDRSRISSIPMWVRLRGLPLPLWITQGLSMAASMFEVDSPLTDKPQLVQVEYEWKPPRCERCHSFGHNCVVREEQMAKGNQKAKVNRKEEEEPLKAMGTEGSSQTPTSSATNGGQQKGTTTPQASGTTQPATVPCNKEEDHCVPHCMASQLSRETTKGTGEKNKEVIRSEDTTKQDEGEEVLSKQKGKQPVEDDNPLAQSLVKVKKRKGGKKKEAREPRVKLEKSWSRGGFRVAELAILLKWSYQVPLQDYCGMEPSNVDGHHGSQWRAMGNM